MPKKTNVKKFTVIRDTQEKKGYYKFDKNEFCEGTEPESMDTGDYTLKGLESIFSIERKASTGELAKNINEKRFENELKRACKLSHFWILCEFDFDAVFEFPYNSTIPPVVWPKLRVTANFLLKKIIELQCKYGCQFIFAGNALNAKRVAISIFKEMSRKYASKLL